MFKLEEYYKIKSLMKNFRNNPGFSVYDCCSILDKLDQLQDSGKFKDFIQNTASELTRASISKLSNDPKQFVGVFDSYFHKRNPDSEYIQDLTLTAFYSLLDQAKQGQKKAFQSAIELRCKSVFSKNIQKPPFLTTLINLLEFMVSFYDKANPNIETNDFFNDLAYYLRRSSAYFDSEELSEDFKDRYYKLHMMIFERYVDGCIEDNIEPTYDALHFFQYTDNWKRRDGNMPRGWNKMLDHLTKAGDLKTVDILSNEDFKDRYYKLHMMIFERYVDGCIEDNIEPTDDFLHIFIHTVNWKRRDATLSPGWKKMVDHLIKHSKAGHLKSMHILSEKFIYDEFARSRGENNAEYAEVFTNVEDNIIQLFRDFEGDALLDLTMKILDREDLWNQDLLKYPDYIDFIDLAWTIILERSKEQDKDAIECVKSLTLKEESYESLQKIINRKKQLHSIVNGDFIEGLDVSKQPHGNVQKTQEGDMSQDLQAVEPPKNSEIVDPYKDYPESGLEPIKKARSVFDDASDHTQIKNDGKKSWLSGHWVYNLNARYKAEDLHEVFCDNLAKVGINAEEVLPYIRFTTAHERSEVSKIYIYAGLTDINPETFNCFLRHQKDVRDKTCVDLWDRRLELAEQKADILKAFMKDNYDVTVGISYEDDVDEDQYYVRMLFPDTLTGLPEIFDIRYTDVFRTCHICNLEADTNPLVLSGPIEKFIPDTIKTVDAFKSNLNLLSALLLSDLESQGIRFENSTEIESDPQQKQNSHKKLIAPTLIKSRFKFGEKLQHDPEKLKTGLAKLTRTLRQSFSV